MMKTNSDSKWWLSESVVRKSSQYSEYENKEGAEVVSAALSVKMNTK